MNNPKDHGLVLGLDIGIGSCGWSLLDMDGKKIIVSGVRLWDVPQEPKTKASTASTRRAARATRRNLKRTANRKKHCVKLLRSEGLVPKGEGAQWLQTRKKDKPIIKLRAVGLDRRLSDREWAQVLYSLCSRRGYIPHGEGKGADAETGKVLKAVSQNKKLMEEGAYRTIGEMLSKQSRSRNREGDYSLCVNNSDLVDEIAALFVAQRSFGNEKASEDFEKQYLDVFLWQKDTADTDARNFNQVGYCTYFPNEKRAAKACLSSELCEAHERVGHAVWIDAKGGQHKLPADIRKRIIDVLFNPSNKKHKVTYKTLRTWMDLNSDFAFKGIDAEKESKTEIYSPKAWSLLLKNLPHEFLVELWTDRSRADSLLSCLTFASSEQSLANCLEEEGFDGELSGLILNLPYNSKLFSGYGSRSKKALNLLLDSFEEYDEVTTLFDAEQASGLFAKRVDKSERTYTQLPPYLVFDPACSNPVVLRVMGQVRKVVNAIIREYGMPDEIHIELARELKHSKREKQLIHSRNLAKKDSREAIVNKLMEELGTDPRGSLIFKVELWNDQDGKCMYCDSPLEYERVITEEHYCEVDHALPFSRTCDDSQANKVLSCKACNQEKKNRTPYEWFIEEGLTWDDFCLRVTRNKNIGYNKRTHLLCENLDVEKEGEFINRNLNDTRYASKTARDYLETYLQFPESKQKQHVFAVSGGATAVLRNAWGIRKSREEDSLHHAADAAVIAACTPSLVKRIAKANERKRFIPKEERKKLFSDTQPWDGFTQEVADWENVIIPSYMTDHKISGRLFEDTVYRFLGIREDGAKGILARKKDGVEEIKVSSNYWMRPDGAVQIVDELAYINLWFDPEAKNGKGQYLLEPVYKADIPFVGNDDYIHKFVPPQKGKKPRTQWDSIPSHVMSYDPVTLFPNDLIRIKGELRRFQTINISSCSWVLSDPIGRLSDSEATKGLAFGSLGKGEQLEKIEEDVLGLCLV